MSSAKDMKKEDLFKPHHGLTWGELKKRAEQYNIPDDAPIVVERVEDVYYRKHGWRTYKKKGDAYRYAERHNERVNEAIAHPEESPDWKDPQLIDLNDPNILTEYTHAWSLVYYKDDPNILFIDLHY